MTRSELVCGIWTQLHKSGFTAIDGERYAENVALWLLDHGLMLDDLYTTQQGGVNG